MTEQQAMTLAEAREALGELHACRQEGVHPSLALLDDVKLALEWALARWARDKYYEADRRLLRDLLALVEQHAPLREAAPAIVRAREALGKTE